MRLHRVPGRTARLATLLLVLLALGGGSVAAQDHNVVSGHVIDLLGAPVDGFRVVFREAQSARIFLSEPTDVEGRYVAALPAGSYIAFALVADDGRRVSLGDVDPFVATPGLEYDISIEIEVPRPPIRLILPDKGMNRLFLSFVEDAVVPDSMRFEGQLDLGFSSPADSRISRYTAAFQFKSIPKLEVGARLGLGGIDTPAGIPNRTGLSDLDLWARFTLDALRSRRPDLAFGGVVTLPTTDADSGLGVDAARSKLFAAARWYFLDWSLAANVGVRVNESARVGNAVLDGQVAGALGVAYIRELPWNLVGVAELSWEGARFKGEDDDARLLVGVNWKLVQYGHLRLALGLGLTDGAPDWQLLGGYVFVF